MSTLSGFHKKRSSFLFSNVARCGRLGRFQLSHSSVCDHTSLVPRGCRAHGLCGPMCLCVACTSVRARVCVLFGYYSVVASPSSSPSPSPPSASSASTSSPRPPSLNAREPNVTRRRSALRSIDSRFDSLARSLFARLASPHRPIRHTRARRINPFARSRARRLRRRRLRRASLGDRSRAHPLIHPRADRQPRRRRSSVAMAS